MLIKHRIFPHDTQFRFPFTNIIVFVGILHFLRLTQNSGLKESRKGGGGYSSEFLVGVCRPVPQILTQFQTKIFNFPHPFSDLAPKMYTRFQTFVVSYLSFASLTKSRIGKIQLE